MINARKQYGCLLNEKVVLWITDEKLIYCNRECRNKFIEDSTEDENIHNKNII